MQPLLQFNIQGTDACRSQQATLVPAHIISFISNDSDVTAGKENDATIAYHVSQYHPIKAKPDKACKESLTLQFIEPTSMSALPVSKSSSPQLKSPSPKRSPGRPKKVESSVVSWMFSSAYNLIINFVYFNS